MRTWHIITSEYPPDVGGVSDYTHRVAEGLAAIGDDVHVWCPHTAPQARSSLVHVRPELGGIRPSDLRRLDRSLNRFPGPRRLLVQWVPHGFGYHSMNVWFCVWLATRAWRGDRIDLMVHEPYLEFGRGRASHLLIAFVHRVMTIILLAASGRVWMSIPAWETFLRPYALGRTIPMEWLPVPGCVDAITGESTACRQTYATEGQPLIGHFGSYGREVSKLLEQRLPAILESDSQPAVLLIGAGSERLRHALIERNVSWAPRVHATGRVAAADLGVLIALCDMFVQPYPDGISSRRTSAMAVLAQGLPVVTTSGHLTEPLWADTGCVVLNSIAEPLACAAAVEALISSPEARRRLGTRAKQVCVDRFSLQSVVERLRAA